MLPQNYNPRPLFYASTGHPWEPLCYILHSRLMMSPSSIKVRGGSLITWMLALRHVPHVLTFRWIWQEHWLTNSKSRRANDFIWTQTPALASAAGAWAIPSSPCQNGGDYGLPNSVVWIWNVLYRFMCLNVWFPDGDTVLGGHGRIWTQSLADTHIDGLAPSTPLGFSLLLDC